MRHWRGKDFDFDKRLEVMELRVVDPIGLEDASSKK